MTRDSFSLAAVADQSRAFSSATLCNQETLDKTRKTITESIQNQDDFAEFQQRLGRVLAGREVCSP